MRSRAVSFPCLCWLINLVRAAAETQFCFQLSQFASQFLQPLYGLFGGWEFRRFHFRATT